MSKKKRNRDRFNLAISAIPSAVEVPDRTALPVDEVKAGTQAGWLLVTNRMTPTVRDGGRARCRAVCRCGALIFPADRDIASGAVRSCGQLSVHGRGI